MKIVFNIPEVFDTFRQVHYFFKVYKDIEVQNH